MDLVAFYNQDAIHGFIENDDGVVRETWGAPPDRGGAEFAGYAQGTPLAWVRVIPGPPDNPYYTWYFVCGVGESGQLRTIAWYGRKFGDQGNHWEGPVDGPPPAVQGVGKPRLQGGVDPAAWAAAKGEEREGG